MNIFFPIISKDLKYLLTVPKFKNKSIITKNIDLFSMYVNEDNWVYEKVNCKSDENFFYVDEDLNEVHKFYFLAVENELRKLNDNITFQNLNNYTDTEPAYRANIRIYNKVGGFSSYQSEYPFAMSQKKGSIMSPLGTLLFVGAEFNKLFLVNFYAKAIKEKFKIYFIDISKKKVLHEETIITNTINEIEIDRKFIDKNVYLFSKNYVGIPIFVSSKDGQLSCEHTHPPHEYIISYDKFKIVSEVKSKFNEIIS